MFYKKELQKTHQKEFRVEKVMNRKSYMLNGNFMLNKQYVKWKGYNNSFKS